MPLRTPPNSSHDACRPEDLRASGGAWSEKRRPRLGSAASMVLDALDEGICPPLERCAPAECRRDSPVRLVGGLGLDSGAELRIFIGSEGGRLRGSGFEGLHRMERGWKVIKVWGDGPWNPLEPELLGVSAGAGASTPRSQGSDRHSRLPGSIFDRCVAPWEAAKPEREVPLNIGHGEGLVEPGTAGGTRGLRIPAVLCPLARGMASGASAPGSAEGCVDIRGAVSVERRGSTACDRSSPAPAWVDPGPNRSCDERRALPSLNLAAGEARRDGSQHL